MSNHNFPYNFNVKKVIYRKFNPHIDCTEILLSIYNLPNVLQKLQLTSSHKMYIFTTNMPFIHKYLCDEIITHFPKFRSKRIFNCYYSYTKVPYLSTMLCILSNITTSLYYALDIKIIILYFNQDIYLFPMLCILSNITTSLYYALDIKIIILYFNQDIYLFPVIGLIFLVISLHVPEKTHVLYTTNNIYVNIIICSSCQITKIAQMQLAFIYNCCKHTSHSLLMSKKMHKIHNFPLKQNNANNAR